jgi:hypothetical protein
MTGDRGSGVRSGRLCLYRGEAETTVDSKALARLLARHRVRPFAGER